MPCLRRNPALTRARAQTLILVAGVAVYRYGFDVLTEVSGPREAEMARQELKKRSAALKAMLKSWISSS